MEQKDYVKGLLRFIEKSPSTYHVIENIRETLRDRGFQELREQDRWNLTPGEDYFVVRGDTSVVAFRMPEEIPFAGFHMLAAHSDSPTFRVKANPEITVEGKYVKLNTEKYGGMIMSTWMDRPLSVAGRILYEADGRIRSKNVKVDKDLMVIPSLAIHMSRDLDKGTELNPQVDLLPLYSMKETADRIIPGKGETQESRNSFLEQVAEAAGVDVEAVLDYDLYLYVREKGRVLGAKGEFIHSPKLDDLMCVYAGLEAFTEVTPDRYCNVYAVFDNEEVGSTTRQGANSTFLQDVLKAITLSVSSEEEQMLRRLLAKSFLISADNAHAVHPNHPEKADPTNRPYLNGGLVLKYHGGQKYTTDGYSGAKMRQWAREAGANLQTYTNRSDVAGGSTLGNISASQVSVLSADVGLPQLSMHSAVETAGTEDLEQAIDIFQTYWEE